MRVECRRRFIVMTRALISVTITFTARTIRLRDIEGQKYTTIFKNINLKQDSKIFLLSANQFKITILHI